jgi:hypothetical protein
LSGYCTSTEAIIENGALKYTAWAALAIELNCTLFRQNEDPLVSIEVLQRPQDSAIVNRLWREVKIREAEVRSST